jgi:hypothetical protein
VVREGLSVTGQQTWVGAALQVVSSAFPFPSDEVATWPARARLLPHALVVVDYARTLDVEAATAARLLNEAAEYLRSVRRVLGEDHPSTLTSMNNLATIRREQGEL